jgi:hypothetical protein
MKNYKLDLDALNIPWLDSPFFPSLIKNVNLSDKEQEQLYHFHSKGYLIVDLQLNDLFFDQLVSEYLDLLNYENLKTNSSFFHIMKAQE